MQPVTMSRRHAPSFLCCAISRMVSIDSCFALSMKAQVLTTSTSASLATCVSSWPACCARPSITSESTRFFGQPSEISPIFICLLSSGDGVGARPSRIQPIQHPRIRNRLAHVFELADPRHDALDAHAEAAMRHGAVAPQIQVPLERFLRQVVLLDALQQQVEIGEPFAAADDLAVPLRREDVDAEREIGPL